MCIRGSVNSTFSTVIDNILAIGLLFEYINHEGTVLGIPALLNRRLEVERTLLRSSYGRRNGIALHIGLGRTQNMVESIVRLLVFNIILNQHASDLVITGLLELNGRLDLSRRTFERGGRFHTANGRIGFLRMTDLLPDRSFGNGTRSDTDNQIFEIIRPGGLHPYFHLTLQTNPLRTPIRIHWHSFRLVGGNDQKMVTVRFIQRIEISLCRNTIPARHIRTVSYTHLTLPTKLEV